MPLISVQGDVNSHGGGALIPTQNTVFINNKPVIRTGDPAESDQFDHFPPADSASPNVFVENKAVHRQNDTRTCGATTIVIGQSNVFAN